MMGNEMTGVDYTDERSAYGRVRLDLGKRFTLRGTGPGDTAAEVGA
jgi:hypothetical protein